MFKANIKKLIVAASTIAIVVVSVAANDPQENQQKKRNLKVLPANISHDSLDHLMDEYKFALKVNCSYCHAPSKTDPKKRDMASDDNPMKDVARKMIVMTNELNEKYIHTLKHLPTDSAAVQMVNCNTCHRGEKRPIVATMPAKPEKQGSPLLPKSLIK